MTFDYPLWPDPTPGDQDLNKLESSTLLENASTQFTAFLAYWF